jgi:hypothetical protein
MKSSLNEQEQLDLLEWQASSERNQKLFNRLTSKSYWEKTGKIDLKEQWSKVIQKPRNNG